MKDFLLNKDFSMLQIPSDNLIPQTTGVFMSRTIKMVFNVHQRTFELGYLNYEVDKSVRNSTVHCYYLSIDTRLSQFIEFLVTVDPKQERQSKINNIRQVLLKVTLSSKGQIFYNIIIKGETTGVMNFKPSELTTSEEETNFSDLEPLINSIINEEEESYNSLKLQLNESNNFTINYSDYDYFKDRGNHIYDVAVDSKSLELLEFLRNYYPRVNSFSSEVDQIYVRISEKKKIASLIIYPVDNSEYEQIDFIPLLLEDSNLSNTLPNFNKGNEKMDIKQQIISVCKDITDSRNQTTQKLNELEGLLTTLNILEEEKKPGIKEVIHKVYKQELGGGNFVFVGTKTLDDSIIFRVAPQLAPQLKKVQNNWRTYHRGFFNYQTETYYDDGTVELGYMLEFLPKSNKIQEIESSDRKGVIGFVEQIAGVVEIIYYDRYIN